jgi:hypothetical protein
MSVAAAKLAASWVQPWSMHTRGTAVCGSAPAGTWTRARLVRPATVNVRSLPTADPSATAMPAGRSPVAIPARSITARLEA